MAIPKFTPTDPTDVPRVYGSPDFVPEPWKLDRKSEIVGRQPKGDGLGNPGPDQGYVLLLAARVRDRIRVQSGESIDDVIAGSITIALRRAAQFGRAPVMTDILIALTIWGWLLDNPPLDIVSIRQKLFAGLGNAEERANLIVYLNAQGSNLPLPAAPAAAAPDAAKPADAAAAAPAQAAKQ